MGTPALVLAAVYLAAVLALGAVAAGRTRTARDFFVAGRSVGLWVTGLTAMAAAFSGFVFVGGPGLTYRLGLASLWICLPAGFTSGLLCWSVARPLARLAAAGEVWTLPDVLLERYGSRLVAGLGAGAVLVGSLAYLGAQLQALGLVVAQILPGRGAGGGLALAMAVGAAAVAAYSTAGGMVAGVWTDVLQGLVMLAAALGVFVWALEAGGGLAAMAATVAGSERFGAAFLDPLGGGAAATATAAGFLLVFSVGTLGQPQLLHKFLMLDEEAKLRWLPAILGTAQSLCLLVWLGIGLAVPALVAGGRLAPLAHPDDAALAFLFGFTPPLLASVAVVGVLAAIMSTADSFLNIAAAVLVRDLPRAFGRRPRAELARARRVVPFLALAAAVFAYLYDDLIALVGTFAFGTFAAALAPALAIGLNWRRVTAGAAAASIATGLATNFGLEVWSRTAPGGGPLAAGALPSAAALAASLAVLLLASLRPRR